MIRPALLCIVPAWTLLICLAFLGCDQPDPPALVAQPGYALYQDQCRKCHGGTGVARRASRMAKRPVDFTAPAFKDTTTLETVTRIIRVGKGRMEGHADDLNEAQMDTLARLVLGFPYPEAP